jgi:hypothetical protein
MVDRRRETARHLQDKSCRVSHLLSAESHHVGFALRCHWRRLSKVAHRAAPTKVMVDRGARRTGRAESGGFGEPLSPADPRRAADYVNREFHGPPLVQVRDALLARLNEVKSLYDTLMRHAWDSQRGHRAHASRTGARRRHGDVGGLPKRRAPLATPCPIGLMEEAAPRAAPHRALRRTGTHGRDRCRTPDPSLQNLSSSRRPSMMDTA